MPVCLIALGGNVGDVHRTFSDLYERLDDDEPVALLKTASLYETRPVGETAGNVYLNSAVEIETNLHPLPLLDYLESLESDFGRSVKGDRGPRTLDLDLVFYGSEVLNEPRLTVPHPACWYRRFVLDPLSEIAPDFIHPVKKSTVLQLRDRLRQSPFRLGIVGGNAEQRLLVSKSLHPDFPQVEIASVESADRQLLENQTVIVWLGGSRDIPNGLSFEELPLVSRLDLSTISEDIVKFLKNVLNSAVEI